MRQSRVLQIGVVLGYNNGTMKNTSILNLKLINERYFYPRADAFKNPFWVEKGDIKLGCYYLREFPDAPTVIFFHGNGEVVADYIDLYIPAFRQMGCNCLLAEYRGYGMSEGIPALGAMLEDVEAIIEAVEHPLEKIILFGRSVGSIYALEGVSRFPTIGGLIIESGIADVLERLIMRIHPAELQELGVTPQQFKQAVDDQLDHQKKLAAYKGATLILHARHDSLVNVVHGQRLYNWAPEPKHIRVFEQGDHNDIMMVNVAEYFGLIARFAGQFMMHPG